MLWAHKCQCDSPFHSLARLHMDNPNQHHLAIYYHTQKVSFSQPWHALTNKRPMRQHLWQSQLPAIWTKPTIHHPPIHRRWASHTLTCFDHKMSMRATCQCLSLAHMEQLYQHHPAMIIFISIGGLPTPWLHLAQGCRWTATCDSPQPCAYDNPTNTIHHVCGIIRGWYLPSCV